ncbi:MAG TPA: hypothetical protein D7I09_04010, partial [Candidatus Poseidoniales archaeon]
VARPHVDDVRHGQPTPKVDMSAPMAGRAEGHMQQGRPMLWLPLVEGAVALWFGLPFLLHRQRCAAA